MPVRQMRIVEIAAILGSTPYSMAEKMTTGSVVFLIPIRNIETGTLSKDTIKVKMAPAMMPGRMAGKMIKQNKWPEVDPKTAKKRAILLKKEAGKLRKKVLAGFRGKKLSVLLEKENADGSFSGYTDNYLPFKTPGQKHCLGEIKTFPYKKG